MRINSLRRFILLFIGPMCCLCFSRCKSNKWNEKNGKFAYVGKINHTDERGLKQGFWQMEINDVGKLVYVSKKENFDFFNYHINDKPIHRQRELIGLKSIINKYRTTNKIGALSGCLSSVQEIVGMDRVEYCFDDGFLCRMRIDIRDTLSSKSFYAYNFNGHAVVDINSSNIWTERAHEKKYSIYWIHDKKDPPFLIEESSRPIFEIDWEATCLESQKVLFKKLK